MELLQQTSRLAAVSSARYLVSLPSFFSRTLSQESAMADFFSCFFLEDCRVSCFVRKGLDGDYVLSPKDEQKSC